MLFSPRWRLARPRPVRPLHFTSKQTAEAEEEDARMGEKLLATSGDTIKLWNASTYAFCEEIPSESGHVSRLAWNQDGQCLASLSDSGKEIHFSAICGKSRANIGVMRGIESPTCLDFASRCSHYLGVGSASGLVTIWNVKSHSKKNVFAPTDQAINRIAFSLSDSHIAAATKKGTLYMLSVLNKLTAGPYKIFNNQVVTDLTYSRVKKSLLGCCSEGGAVALYDTHANKVVHSFPDAHSFAVNAISFSPVNEFLMVSVGYDKKLCCFNVQSKQPVMTHRSSAPLTSIAFLSMGQLVALGTMTGEVLIHDMRTINTPLATLKAHKSAVTNVLLQPSIRSKSSSNSRSGQRSGATCSMPVPSQRPVKSCSDNPSTMSPEMEAKPESVPETGAFDLSVFSPVRDTNLPSHVQVQIDVPVESAFLQSLLSPVRTTDLHNNHHSPSAHHMDINEDNLLSPVRDTTINAGNEIALESPILQLKSPSAMEMSPTPTDITDKENIEPLTAVAKDQSPATQQTDSNVPSPATHSPATLEDRNRSKGINSSIWISPAPPVSIPFTTPSRISPPKKRQLLRPVRASDLAPNTPTQLQTAVDEPAPAAASDVPAASNGVPQLQIDLIRSCMVDVLEEFQDDMNSRLMHLQYIITKKFIQQQELMEKLHQQYSLNEEVMKENESLRQQLARLQAKY
ncbi:protein NEDD1-like isoform X2 [Portunus trituberculatus]|uniref:protein NEDD1-like isoform X2 n=1 Tax=Portunus trituberculatus TaxID=210409 RepID=UPI001E1CF1B7|nr:protein NEDD1-like isoform X2 [Portunus trituberculatus]